MLCRRTKDWPLESDDEARNEVDDVLGLDEEPDKMKRYTLASCLLVIVACSLHALTPKHDGVIKGVVLDEGGKPVASAQVTWVDQEPSPKGEVDVTVGSFWAESNNAGRFQIGNLIVGHSYKLYAKKEDAGYPDTKFAVYNPAHDAPLGIAQPRDRALDVRVQIGPKAAILEYDAKDAVTGSRITNPTIRVVRADGQGDFGGSSMDNKCLVPSDADVMIEVSANGYQTWFHPGYTDKTASTPLRMAPGENRKLDVRLQPAPK